MKIITLLATLALIGCTAPANWDAALNPLDQPGHSEPTVAELHQGNLSEITSNPAYR